MRITTPLAVVIAVAFFSAFSVLSASSAYASPTRAGGDVGVIVTGEGSMQPQLAAQISDWLSRHGHTVVASPLPADAIPLLVDCFVMEKLACARNIVETRAKSTSVVYARVETESNPDDGTRNVTLTAYWFAKGRDAIAERKTCEQCTARSLRTTADEVMTKLVGGEGHVKLKSTPPGARIVIDGQPIGITPLDWDLPAGKHTIQMDKPGLTPATSDIVVVSGKTDVLEMELVPPRHAPLGMMVAGGGMVISGVILTQLDEPRVGSKPARVLYTSPLGYGLAIGGVVLAGTGVYLQWFRSPRKTSTPVAVFTSDSAYVGWSGQF